MANVFRSTKIRPRDPHLTVYIHAPGLIVFNKTAKQAECGLLELCDHVYVGSVYEYQGANVRKIFTEIINWNETRVGSGDTIELLNGSPNRYEDFDKIFEMTDLYDDGIVLHPDKDQWRTKFFFKNMIFATSANSVVKGVPSEVGSNRRGSEKDVGRAVMILSRDGEIVPPFNLGRGRITMDPNRRYEMVIRQVGCRSGTGDFKHLYDVLRKTDGAKHQLEYLGNPLPWKSPAEQRLLEKYLDLAIAIHKGDKTSMSNKERKELAFHLKAMADSLLCDGVACLEGTIKGKSLSIPI